MTTTTYEFSAFTEADLLDAGAEGHSVSCGDTFTMSGTATTCFEVTDNDAFLSGDNYCNENANDHYGQQASITGENGQEIGNGGQIYAEKYFWVCDDAGNWYVLLQIEQEGTNEEYFTFFNGYGYETPAEGTELTVYSGCNVTSNWVDYKCLDAGEKEVDPGWIKGRLTLDADCNDNEWNEDTGQWDEGVEGQTVQLLDLDGNVVAESVTDSYGNYMFDVAPGQYRVKFPEIDGMKFSEQDSGVAEHFDSDADENGLTDVITVGSGQTIANIDAGVKPATGSIEGTVFADEDCDGLQGGEVCILGDNLVMNGDFEDNALNNTGWGLFDSLPGGWYAIQDKIEVQESNYGTGNTQGNAVVELDANNNAIICQQVDVPETCVYQFSIDYAMRGSDAGTNGFAIYIDGELQAEVFPTEGGFQNLTFEIELEAGATRIDLKGLGDSDCIGTVIDNVSLQKKTVEVAEPGVEGVIVVLTDANGDEVLDGNGDRIETVTDADGNYRFDDVVEGDYRVKFENPDGTDFTFQNVGDDDTIDSDVDGNGVSDVISVVADQTTSDVDAGLKSATGSIEGRVFCDEDCDGIDGTATSGKGDNLLVNSGFEHNTLNDSGYTWEDLSSGWYNIGTQNANILEQDYGHGNATGDAIAELECGVILCQAVNLDEAGSYCLSFDISRRGHVDQDNTFQLFIDGVLFETYVAQGQETIEIQLDLGAGTHRFDFKSLSQSYKGAGLDDVELRQEIDTVEPEPGKEGVVVVLLDANGDEVLDGNGDRIETVTDADGNYRFDDVVEGDYRVKFENPDGTEFTFQNVGDDDTVDSDVDGNGVSDVVTVVADQTTSDVDAGLKPVELGSLSGRYFSDENRDGLDNDGANGISGIQVELLDENGVGLGIFETTDAEGNYSFGDLEAGTYGVKFTDPDTGRELTTQNVDMDASDDIDSDAADIGGGMSAINGITVVAGQDTPDNDAGVVELLGSLSGRYFCDDDGDGLDNDGANGGEGEGIEGIRVDLLDANGQPTGMFTTTGPNGAYSFTGLVAGTYGVQFADSPPTKDFTTTNADNDVSDDIDSDAVANNDGTATISAITVVGGQDTADNDVGVTPIPGSLSGRYFCDTDGDSQDNNNGDEPGIEGVLVSLLNADGSPTGRTTTTDSNGNYSFGDLEAGTYGVSFTDPDNVLDGKVLVDPNVGDDASDSDAIGDTTSSTITGIDVAAGADTPDNDAGVVELGSLSGRYFCDNDGDGLDNDGDTGGEGPGVAGIRVDLLDETGAETGRFTTTDAQGNYSFANLAAGTYGVRFAEGVLDKVLTTQNVDNDASDDIDSDAMGDDLGFASITNITVFPGQNTPDNDIGVRGNDPMTGEIGDTVWLDTFGDGILNDEASDDFFSGREQGVEGVTVQLKDAVTGEVLEEQVTNASGQYLFSGLKGGDYVVGFVLPDGFEFTAQNVGGDEARDSDADRTTGMTDVISLPPGGSVLTVDAGLLRCGLIEGSSQADENSPVGGYDLLVGCATDDTIIGLSGEDTLVGENGDDDLQGESFDDLLFGGGGNDTLRGGSENDVLDGGLGDDLIIGEGERDVAVFSVASTDAMIEVVDVFTGELTVASADGVDTVRSVEVLRFTDGDIEVDDLVPGGSRDVVAAPTAGGSVNIDVLANDLEVGEGVLAVAQVNDGGFGVASIEGDGTVTYTANADFAGYDFFTYTATNGVGFVRTVEVQVGDLPRPDSNDPNVTVLDDFIGADGANFSGTGSDDTILGGVGFDTIDARNGTDVVDGGKGDDFIRGGGGTDLILGGEGSDRLQADNGADAVFGELGGDRVIGQAGDDILFGGDGDDVVGGFDGSDYISAGAGDDRIENFRDGADVALGGSGEDSFVWSEVFDGAERDFLDGESGEDELRITLDAGTDAVAVQAEIDAYLATATALPGAISDGSTLNDTFSFTTIGLDIRNIEDVFLA